MVKRSYRWSRSGTLALALVVTLSGCSPQMATKNREMQVIQGQTMGTLFAVKYSGGPVSLSQDHVQAGIHQVLDRVNRQMSTYMPDSGLSRFNRYPKDDWFPVSPGLAFVMAESIRVSRLSGGAFDITVGPLVNLWGFGPGKRRDTPPTAEEIRELLPLTGYQKIGVRLSPPAVKKELPGIYCDLSAIAKGYGVDQVAEYLESKKIFAYLVEIGGEVRARGKNPDNRCWQVGIAVPDREGEIERIVPLENSSMATSGDYHNYFEKDGIRYSHTIDPQTGRPITHGLASVTVVHPSCTFADAMATAINVLGPEQGLALAKRENLAVFLIIRDKTGFTESMTPGFAALLPQRR